MIMERMLFTLRDSAAMLGVSRNQVHELINSERLASVKPGRSRRSRLVRSGGFVHAGMAAA
jgi:excisionase family DNA binding protein